MIPPLWFEKKSFFEGSDMKSNGSMYLREAYDILCSKSDDYLVTLAEVWLYGEQADYLGCHRTLANLVGSAPIIAPRNRPMGSRIMYDALRGSTVGDGVGSLVEEAGHRNPYVEMEYGTYDDDDGLTTFIDAFTDLYTDKLVECAESGKRMGVFDVRAMVDSALETASPKG